MSASPIAAFDYQRQAWIMDPPEAAETRECQILEELAILQGPRGDDYARFLRADTLTLIVHLERELSALRASQP